MERSHIGEEVDKRQAMYPFLIGLAFLVLLLLAFIAIEYPVDDAFIVFRYVDRALEGKGLTFNDHEYVEGYTSLSWTLLLTLLGSIGLNPHVAALLANYAFLVLIAWTLHWLLLIFRLEMAFRVMAMLFLGTSLLFFKVIYLGLELGMFIWLLMLFVCVLLAGVHYPDFDAVSKPYLVLSGVLAALLFATRPESILLPPLLLTCLAIRRKRKAVISHVQYVLVPFAILCSLLIVWRLLYYGELLPNSVIAKSIAFDTLGTRRWGTLKDLIAGSGEYFFQSYKENPLLLLVPILCTFLLLKNRQPLSLILMLVPVAWQYLVVVVNGGDWMPYHRFLNMYMPFLVMGLAVGSAEVFRTSQFMGGLLLATAICLQVYTNWGYTRIKADFVQKALGTAPNDRWHEGDLYQALGNSLNDVWIEADILVPEAIGIIGYSAPRIYIHDPAGLTDKTLAKDQHAFRSVYGKTNWHYSVGLNPAIVLLHWWPQELSREDLGRYDFYCAGPFPTADEGDSLYVLIRQDRVANYGTAITSLGLESISAADHDSIQGAATLWCRDFLNSD